MCPPTKTESLRNSTRDVGVGASRSLALSLAGKHVPSPPSLRKVGDSLAVGVRDHPFSLFLLFPFASPPARFSLPHPRAIPKTLTLPTF